MFSVSVKSGKEMGEAEDELFRVSSYLEVLKPWKGNEETLYVWGRSRLLAVRASVKAPGQECASHSLLVRFWDNLEKRGMMR